MNTTTIEPVVLTVQEELDQALVRANVTDQRINELIAKAKEFDFEITTEEQYAAAERARLDIKKVRIIGEKGVEAIDRRYLDLRQASLAKKKEILGRINEPEVIILGRTRAWELKKEHEAKEANERAKREFLNKCTCLESLGFIFVTTNDAYVLGETIIQKPALMAAQGEQWEILLGQARLVSEEVATQKAEEERVRREQQEAFEAQQAELARLREQEEARVREAADREKAAKDLVERERIADLRDLGLVYGADSCFHYGTNEMSEWVTAPLAEYEDSEWPLVIGAVKEKIERIKAHDAELEERRKKYEEEERVKAAAKHKVDSRAAGMRQAGWANSSNGEMLELYVPSNVIPHMFAIQQLANATDETYVELLELGWAETQRRADEEAARAAAESQAAKDTSDAEIIASVKDPNDEPQLFVGNTDLEAFEEWVGWIRLNAPKLDSAQGDHGVRRILKYIDSLVPGITEALKQD